MKAIIKIVTAKKEFTPDQTQILRRIVNVLCDHNLSAAILLKKKVKKDIKFKKVRSIFPSKWRINTKRYNA